MPRTGNNAEGPYVSNSQGVTDRAHTRPAPITSAVEATAAAALAALAFEEEAAAAEEAAAVIIETALAEIVPSTERTTPPRMRSRRSQADREAAARTSLGDIAAAFRPNPGLTVRNDDNDQSHNRDTSVDTSDRLRDYERGWLPESVYSPIRPFEWVRVVKRISSRVEHGMRCFSGTYMDEHGPTSMTPGDICIVCTELRLLHLYVFMGGGQWYSIDHTPVAWRGDWASGVCTLLDSWIGLSRTLRIFRACNEAISTLTACVTSDPTLRATYDPAIEQYTTIMAAATAQTGSLTLPLIQNTIDSLIANLVRQTRTDRETVINLLGTVIETMTHDESLRSRKIIELRIEGLDQLINAVMMIFGANIRQGSAVTMLNQALTAVQQNAGTLANWVQQTPDVTNENWNKVSQYSATRTRQLNRFKLRRRSTDADGSRVSTDNPE